MCFCWLKITAAGGSWQQMVLVLPRTPRAHGLGSSHCPYGSRHGTVCDARAVEGSGSTREPRRCISPGIKISPAIIAPWNHEPKNSKFKVIAQ